MFKKKDKNKKNKYRNNNQSAKASRVKRHAKKKIVNKQRKVQKRINWKKKIVLFLIGCFLFFVGWVLFFSEVLVIKNVEVRGYKIGNDRVKEVVNDFKNEKFLNKISKNNLILFPANRFKKTIREQNIVIKNVNCKKIFPDKIVVDIQERKQLFLWKFGNKCQLRDGDSEFIKNINCGEGKRYLKDKCEKIKKQTKLNCLVFRDIDGTDIDNVEDISKFSRGAKNILEGLKKTLYLNEDILLKTESFIGGELLVESDKYGELKFDVNGDIKKQVEILKLFLEQKINLSDLHKLKYIDLTLENKLIYKFKQNNIEDEEEDVFQKQNKK